MTSHSARSKEAIALATELAAQIPAATALTKAEGGPSLLADIIAAMTPACQLALDAQDTEQLLLKQVAAQQKTITRLGDYIVTLGRALAAIHPDQFHAAALAQIAPPPLDPAAASKTSARINKRLTAARDREASDKVDHFIDPSGSRLQPMPKISLGLSPTRAGRLALDAKSAFELGG